MSMMIDDMKEIFWFIWWLFFGKKKPRDEED